MVNKKRVSSILILALLITSLFSGFAFAADNDWEVDESIKVEGMAHIRKLSDQNGGYVDNKYFELGTEGKGLRIEGIALNLKGEPEDMMIVYRAHARKQGDIPKANETDNVWKDPETGELWRKAGNYLGTRENGLRLEGVQIRLINTKTNKDYEGYKVQYQVHMRTYGWGTDKDNNARNGKADSWVSNGVYAGTRSESKRIEGLRIRILNEGKLKVTGVSADNLKEVEVKFNKPIAKDTVKDANFKISSNTGSVATKAELQDDNKTVILTVKGTGNALENQKNYKLTIENLKDANGKAFPKYEQEFKAFDRSLPVVIDTVVTGPRTLEIVFNEPIKTGGDVEVKFGNNVIGVNPAFTGYESNKITVELYTDLTSGTKYDVSIKNFEDYAGYKNEIAVRTIAYQKDETPPIAYVEKVDQKYVVVGFNKPVKGVTATHFYHTFSAWNAIGVYKDADMKETVAVSDAVNKVYVKFAEDAKTGYPIPEGTTSLVIRDKNLAGVEIKDNWGNKFGGATIPISVSADKIAPAVSELKVDTEESLKIKFNKDVKFSKDNVEVLNADGTKIDGLNISVNPSGTAKEYTINLGKNLAGKSILVNIKNVEDTALAPNKLELYTEILNVTDKTAPYVSKVTKRFVENQDQSLYVFFNESVDSSALNAGNYYLVNNTTYTKLSQTPTFFNGDKIVRIPLTNAQKDLVENDTQLFVTNVKDIAGNTLAAQLVKSIVEYDADDNKPAIDKVEVTETKKMIVTFDQYLTRVDSKAFKVQGDEPASMTLSTDDKGNTVVILTSKNAWKSDASDAELEIVADGKNVRIHNVFGVDVKTTVPKIEDKIAPAIAKLEGKDLVTAKPGVVEITFTEAINPNTVSAISFAVEGQKISTATAKGDTIILELADKNALVEVGKTVRQQAAIADKSGNIVKDLSTKVNFQDTEGTQE